MTETKPTRDDWRDMKAKISFHMLKNSQILSCYCSEVRLHAPCHVCKGKEELDRLNALASLSRQTTFEVFKENFIRFDNRDYEKLEYLKNYYVVLILILNLELIA